MYWVRITNGGSPARGYSSEVPRVTVESLPKPPGVCCMVACSIPVAWRFISRVAAGLTIAALIGAGSLSAQGEGPAESSDRVGKCRGTSGGRYDNPRGVTLADALQGRLPGVSVTSAGGGAATGAGTLRMRGVNTLQSNTPLLYIDDVRVSALPSAGPRGLYAVPLLEFVELSQIKRIEVLRGPAATLRYGQGAGAGVIKIYTRRGRGDEDAGEEQAGCPTP